MMDAIWCKQYPVYRMDDARVLKLCDGCDHKNICVDISKSIERLTELENQLTSGDGFRFVGEVDELPIDTSEYHTGDFILVKRMVKSKEGKKLYVFSDPYVFSGTSWLHLFHDLGIIPVKGGTTENDDNDGRAI